MLDGKSKTNYPLKTLTCLCLYMDSAASESHCEGKLSIDTLEGMDHHSFAHRDGWESSSRFQKCSRLHGWTAVSLRVSAWSP